LDFLVGDLHNSSRQTHHAIILVEASTMRPRIWRAICR